VTFVYEVMEPRKFAIKPQPSENEQLMMPTSDAGVGHPAQQVDQMSITLFTTRLHDAGVELRISRSIVEAHGGRLRAAISQGASFHFALLTAVEAHK
jgi:C4-dicarboxylate-specific signal transduction histidine kinase